MPYYLSRVDHCWKIRADIRKFSFVNRTIAEWNQPPEGAIGTSSRKVKIRELKQGDKSDVK
jgi:hypothetical protein